jgi:DNA polymerase III sliding clamp (beta) subunit (PCNA family)
MPAPTRTERVAADRKRMPMLANVLLRTQGKNQLLVAATDLNVATGATGSS